MTLSFNVSQKSPGEYFISAEELLAGYRSKTPEQSYELEKKQNADLASITQGWFTHNPMTLKNMNSWGRLMICYLNAIEDDITAENVEPLKSYLSVIAMLRHAYRGLGHLPGSNRHYHIAAVTKATCFLCFPMRLGKSRSSCLNHFRSYL